ncbi:MAG: protein kinase, partial [Candidatus Sumerlaeota bacterium]|nr:protein kinase [Candidatus Sumerlaeota bacterium]
MSESLIGRTLGDFRILRLIGAGGMGAVYAAEQVSLGRRVALKVLSPHVGAPGSHGDRFRREAEAAARLNHPSIVSIYAQGNQDNLWYYAMELIEGESLDRLVARLRSSASPQPTESVDPFAVTEKLSATELGSQAAAPAIPPTTAAALTLHRRPRRDWIECAVRYAVEAARAL